MPPNGLFGSSKNKNKRQRTKVKPEKDDFFEDGTNAFQLAAAQDDNVESGVDDDEAVDTETAEEKRVKIAKAYLQQLQRDQQEDSDDEFMGVTGGPEDAVAKQLQQDALEAAGYFQRRLAQRVATGGAASTSGRLMRGHRLSVSSAVLTSDDRTIYSVSKDGSIMQWDVETRACNRFTIPQHTIGSMHQGGTKPDWMDRPGRVVGRQSLLAAAVSSDGKYLAVGGGDRKVHVFDARSREYVQGFPGHRDIVSGLAFREGSHTLLSASFDRTVKIWSLDDRMYIDTLYGHQAGVLCIDMLKAERAVTGGYDHSCRMWKIPEESFLLFRAPGMAVECVRFVSGSEWLTGSGDGSLALWSSMRKKALTVVRGAHGQGSDVAQEAVPGVSAGSVGGDACSWVLSVGVCRGSDLAASGAGDGCIRLWGVGAPGDSDGPSKARQLSCVGTLPARGFVNSLAVASSARFLVAGMGQEPRLGRWMRDPKARNGVLLHEIKLEDGVAAD